MTPDEVRLDLYRTWLLCCAVLAARRGHGSPAELFDRWKIEHGVA